MEIIDELSKKVHQAAREIVELRQDRQQIQSELDLVKNQLKDYHSLVRENERFKREQDQLRARLLRLQKKIEKHLLVETTLAAQSRGGMNNEEHPQ